MKYGIEASWVNEIEDMGLRKQVEGRIKEAREKKIGEKAMNVAKGLGTTAYGTLYGISIYQSGDIYVTNSSALIRVEVGGKEVYKETGFAGVMTYLPGTWMDSLEEYNKQAVEKLGIKEENEKSDRYSQLRKDFDL